ncbi:MAG: endopeptidase La [Anaerolineales bacterium]|jgi:ATP-dependent Lon protease
MDNFSSIIPVQDEGDDESQPILTDHDPEFSEIPDELPILPLRGLVVYPFTATPLTIGQPRSIKLIDDAVAGDRLIGLVASKDPELELPGPEDLYRYGTVASIQRLFRAPDGTIRLIARGLVRFELGEFINLEPYLMAQVSLKPETYEDSLEVEAQVRAAKDLFQQIAELGPTLPREIIGSVVMLDDPLQVAYTISNYQRIDLEDAQELLELDSTMEKLQRLNGLLSREVEVLQLGKQIQQEARTEIEKVQREYFLREQLKAIQKELGESDEQTAEAEEFRRRIAEAQMPEEAEKQALREVERLSRLPTAAAEYGVIRTYLDWMVSLPWGKTTGDTIDLDFARKVLDEDHYGLEDVKERILEYLAVRKLKRERGDIEAGEAIDEIRREREGIILCFVGPPGVGKTSLGQSIARATGREFIRLSLGGVHDEAEIRGHRRTYIGAMPGRVIQALRRVESSNPVFMLDEVDKMGRDFRGDPASALLEVLDPEQNREFRDHYLEVAFDLSQVMFITTANWLETVPEPLMDRMEIIRLSGYTELEKVKIAHGYLIPRQIVENGLKKNEIDFNDEALETVIRSYTREAGVRNLEREIGRLCRKVATRVAEGKTKKIDIDADLVREYLGKPRFHGTEDLAMRTRRPGVATGLAYTPAGGDVLYIEATGMPGNGKQFLVTGSLGQVMQESARAALSHVQSMSDELGIDPEYWSEHDLHLHVPAGAQPKDGPSAGVTMSVALVSLATGKTVRPEVGMTGEVTLQGLILPIGGVKEKVLAAHRAGLKTVLLPKRNEVDLEDVPEEVRKDIKFVFIETVSDAIDAALEGKSSAKKKPDGRTKKTGGTKKKSKTASKKAKA